MHSRLSWGKQKAQQRPQGARQLNSRRHLLLVREQFSLRINEMAKKLNPRGSPRLTMQANDSTKNKRFHIKVKHDM